eukprot:623826-Alexandrium_andersonii.AAC.1
MKAAIPASAQGETSLPKARARRESSHPPISVADPGTTGDLPCSNPAAKKCCSGPPWALGGY